MTATTKHNYPHFVTIQKIMRLPVVSSGFNKATYIYVKVKTSNRVMEYSLGNAEKTVLNVMDLTTPLVIKFEDPINRIDDLMCKSLDVVLQKVPIVTYTPEEIYFTTKTFVKAKVEPVLKRADSVKQLTMLDDALSVADKYVDKYLPDKDPAEDVNDKPSAEPSSQAVKTIRHVNHFSRKLQRRLTRRTIAEAKLLKKQGYDTVQCFVYFADLLAKDPKAFSEKMKAIWIHLSEDEPENQKPPENIEQLIEMLTRESARRFVHVTNFVAKNIYMTPTYSKNAFAYTTHEMFLLADQIIKYAHLEKAQGTVVDVINSQLVRYKKLVEDLRIMLLEYLSSLTSVANESKKNVAEKDDNKNNAQIENKTQTKHKAQPKSKVHTENKNSSADVPPNPTTNSHEGHHKF